MHRSILFLELLFLLIVKLIEISHLVLKRTHKAMNACLFFLIRNTTLLLKIRYYNVEWMRLQSCNWWWTPSTSNGVSSRDIVKWGIWKLSLLFLKSGYSTCGEWCVTLWRARISWDSINSVGIVVNSAGYITFNLYSFWGGELLQFFCWWGNFFLRLTLVRSASKSSLTPECWLTLRLIISVDFNFRWGWDSLLILNERWTLISRVRFLLVYSSLTFVRLCWHSCVRCLWFHSLNFVCK
jgi:hypothetical protein